jgi:membrane-associated phospholipid phosphatase
LIVIFSVSFHTDMRLIIFLSLFILFNSALSAQTDSLKIQNSTSVNNHKTWYKSRYIQESIVPVGLTAASLTIMAIPNLKVDLQSKLMWNDQSKPNYINLGDDYVRYVPAVAAYALSAFGLKSKHRFIDRSVILAVSYIASDFVVYNAKNISQELRPDGGARNSFPSQHAAMAFVAATFLDHELGYISPWISVGGYATASYVAYARIARNAHWTNDVLMGAAVGIIMTNATYWAYDGVMKLFPKNLTISPMIDPQQTGIYLCYKF